VTTKRHRYNVSDYNLTETSASNQFCFIFMREDWVVELHQVAPLR